MKRKHRFSALILTSALLASTMMIGTTLTACGNQQTTVDPKAQAQSVTDKINALTNDSPENDVVSARQAYESLTEEAKSYVTTETLNKLRKQEARIADQKAAAEVEATINALSATPTEEEVDAAVQAYNRLSTAQKGYVSQAAKTKLQAAVKYIEDQKEAKIVSDQIDALDDTSTLNEVIEVKTAYKLLSTEAKAMVASEKVEKLDRLVAAKEEAIKHATEVIEKIEALNDQSTEEEVVEARKAYEKLTAEEKSLLDEDTMNLLLAQEKRIADQKAAAVVTKMIDDLGPTPTKEAVENAEKAYNDLTDDQKAYISQETLEKLAAAREYVDIKVVADAVNKAYLDLNITKLVDLKSTEKAQVVLKASEVVKAYAALSPAAKAFVENADNIETIMSFGYVLYGDGAEDTLTAYDDATSVTDINIVKNNTYGNVYKVDITPTREFINLTLTLDGLLWKGKTIAQDAEKLMMFVSNETTSWGSPSDDCNVAKLNNNYANIASVQLDHEGTWGSISYDLTLGEGLVSEFTCFGFQEKWGGMKSGSLYFSRLVALYPTVPDDDAEKIDLAFKMLSLPDLDTADDYEKSQALLCSNDVVQMYLGASDEVQKKVQCAAQLEKIMTFGYIAYGNDDNDTITAYDDASEVSNITTKRDLTMGEVYQVDFTSTKSSVNASFTLDGLLWKGKTIAQDAEKLIMFASNETTLWGSPSDDCNVAKLNNNYANIASVQLDHEGTWGSISYDLTLGEGLVSEFTCFGFQEKWGGMKSGSLYFTKLVALY